MALSFSNVFGKKSNDTQENNTQTNNATNQNSNIVLDYKQEGVKDAGTAKGEITAFNAGFNAVFHRIKKEQEQNEALQEEMRSDLQKEILNLENEKNTDCTKLGTQEDSLSDIKKDLTEKENELADLKDGNTGKNKEAVVNFYIGLFIIVLLTLYLFIFYSSTAYSAFFKEFGADNTKVTERIFDVGALSSAFGDGIFEGLFILFLPVIFMALGFVIHQFNKSQKGITRYIKTSAMYIGTFIFDGLMAYKISKSIYDVIAESSLDTMPQYSIKMAIFGDGAADFWMVIFCGFLAYVIWGLVFDFVMKSYDMIVNNTHLIDNLKSQIKQLRDDRDHITSEINTLKAKIQSTEAKIKQKTLELTNNVRYNFDTIKANLADYYNGWIGFISLAAGPNKDNNIKSLDNAYQREMREVEDWMSGIKNKYRKQ